MTMKVAVYEGAGSIKLEERPIPKPMSEEVLVKVKYCGICSTDVHAYMHEGILFPGTVFGHETVGVVQEIGSGVEGFSVGDRVAVGPPGLCPEGCYFCRTGRSTLCVNGFDRTLGIGPGTQGAYAEYILARYPNRQLIKIPESISFEDAVLFDVAATPFHGFRRSNFKAGYNAVVIGAGALGLFMIQFLKIAGARHITVLELSEKKSEFALRVGADLVLDPREEPELREKFANLYDGIGPDNVYECAGNPAAVGTALNICKPTGEVILLGTNFEPLSTIYEGLWSRWELDVKGSFANNEDDIRAIFGFMEEGLIKTEGMLSKIVKLEEIEETMKALSKTSDWVRYAIEP